MRGQSLFRAPKGCRVVKTHTMFVQPILQISAPQVSVAPEWYFNEPGSEVLSFSLEGLQPRTRFLYRREFERLRAVIPAEPPWPELAADTPDYLVSQYLVRGYNAEEGSGRKVTRTQAGYLVSHLRYADACNRYPIAHRACGIWRHRSPPVPAWPATPEIAGALAGSIKLANEAPAAVCTYVTFSLLLRIGEALKIRWCDVFLPGRGDVLQEGSAYLGQTKRGFRDWVPITDPGIVDLWRRFKRWANPASSSSRLFPYSYYHYRKKLEAFLVTLLLPIGIWRTHSLRKGGVLLSWSKTRVRRSSDFSWGGGRT